MEKRERFLEAQPTLDVRRLVFLDESGFRLGSKPLYGWVPRGLRPRARSVQGKWETITMIGAIALDGFRGLMTINSGTSTEVFHAYVEQVLVPKLNAGDIIVMDNLSAHRNERVVQLIQKAGCEVIYTPPYSPEFNPIEKAWAKLKSFLRKALTRTRDAFDEAVSAAMDQVSTADIRGWISHCGYKLKQK